MLHLVALSFEHRRGNQIDAIFPPFSTDKPYIADWNQGLPFIAIPDKAHGACSSIIQFTLPETSRPCGCVYGVAAYRSIETSELAKNDPAYVRDHVQRALCIISIDPCFGEIEQPLKKVLYDNFDCLTEKMEEMFNELKPLADNPGPYSGISYASLFQSVRTNVLTIVRGLALQKRILVFADNSELVSKMVVAIASLLPGYFYESDFPFTFLEKGSGVFSFAPYLPLQFTESLNNGGAKSALMGTCSELFIESQNIVTYDILVNCRTMPATVTGEIVKDMQPQANEIKFVNEILKKMETDWTKPEFPDWLRSKFREWFNSVFVALLQIRHIKEVPQFTWIYLDWENLRLFGERFIKMLVENPETPKIIKNKAIEDFQPIYQPLLEKKKQLFGGVTITSFWK